MKYKVGDRVKIQSLERYNKYKNRYGDINYGCETEILFTSEMSSFCGQVVTITRVRYIGCVRFYHLAEDKGVHLWVDGMFEGLAEELLDNDMKEYQRMCDEIMAIQGIEPVEAEMEEDDIFDDTVPLPDSFVERMTHKIVDSELFKAEPLDIPTMTTDFVKEHGLPCPNGYIFKDENGNVINATKIVLEKEKIVNLTQEQINTMVHDSCVLFCKHCGCGIPRETCTSLGTCKEHDEYRAAIRTHLMEKNKKEYPKTYKALEILASRLAESVLMDWDKEEQVKLAKEVACECHKYFNEK